MASGLSGLSSLKDDEAPLYIAPHYRESYRLAIYALLCGGKEAYEEFLRAEQISHLLSDEEILFVLENAEVPEVEEEPEGGGGGGGLPAQEVNPSTYFPTESDEEVPDLDLGWPEVLLDATDTSISLLFHPPRENTPTIKEVVRKQIQEARQVVAIAMDVFTDVDIFKELVGATLRGVMVYILLDDAQFRSFLSMSHRVGVNIQELKNIRVRTVQGQQYQCQSGVKFHGGLEQKFILVDCNTVLYGTYSFAWSFEKLHISMVLVVTGQLVGSYDEEFRRLYAQSTVPQALSTEAGPYLRDPVALQSPNSSHWSLHQLHMTPRGLTGMRTAQDDRFANSAMLTRGLSMQDRLHQSHYPDMGNLVRGHSYGGELQKINSMTRLRMGTKDIGIHDRSGTNLMLPSRTSQHQLRHRSRYGADQNLIPFNSETSLHRWKIDSYLTENDLPLDASYDALSSAVSPFSSHTGLNELQSQIIQNRSRDIKSRMEELRQKRLSMQEYTSLRQSQESLRSMYPSLDRPKYGSSLRNLDMMQSLAELEPNVQDGGNMDSSNQRVNDLSREGDRRETLLKYDWHEPLSRTMSAAELEKKLNDPSLKLSHLQSTSLSNVQSPRAMESLTEVPEERDSSNSRINSSDSVEKFSKFDSPEENSVKSNLTTEPQRRDETRGSRSSLSKLVKTTTASKEKRKSLESIPKSLSTSTGSQHTVDSKSSPTEKSSIQRKNSMRMKVQSMLSPDEKKISKKEEKALQRKASRSQNPSGPNPPLRPDQSQGSSTGQLTKKGQSASVSRSQQVSGPTDSPERHKSAFTRLSPQRSSKRRTNLAAEQDRGSKNHVDDDGATVYQTRREKAYSRYEYLLSTESRTASMYPPDTDRGVSGMYGRHDSAYPMYQTQSGADNKLGRFMQRVGNLIGKNK